MRTELVTTLKRKATKIIADLESDQDPVLITQHGKPAAYLLAVEAFDSLNPGGSVFWRVLPAENAPWSKAAWSLMPKPGNAWRDG